MVPNDHCKPACPDGSLCCRDADTPPPGYCLTVKSCSQVLSSDALLPRRTAWTPSPFDVGDEVLGDEPRHARHVPSSLSPSDSDTEFSTLYIPSESE